MDYLFENLGDERFQEFCTSLLAKEYPNIQAFPVGQPDGGRDFLVYDDIKNKSKTFIVFQVKYVRNPHSMQDIHKWLIELIKLEAPKVDKLIPRGAIEYILLTNVKGTAHLDSGSIDKINSIFKQNIKIPARCLWRDDLSRLFEKDILFKWSFPEILNGQDIINLFVFQTVNNNNEKRERIIRAYLFDQYQIDNEVKFRQIDLQSNLFDLFTDVPVKIKKFNRKDRKLKRLLDIIFHEAGENNNITAAHFLTDPRVQNSMKRILLEGGPGQGKSTISQYICQINRAKLLNKVEDIKKIPEYFTKVAIRLPFKMDLRHIASWVEEKNPYQGKLNDSSFSKIWNKSLESFLIGHIIYHAEDNEFTSTDLYAILKASSILLVFDGFDEIANFDIRKDVIEFINKGIVKLAEYSRSLQVIITSRPAVFSDSVGFAIENYPHFELSAITTTTINEYVEKWIRLSKLDSRESSNIKRLVEEKLKMPHLRDLTTNPMQLAIFINLLRTKGESLPNKRTALYDNYISLFFDRESEKDTTIRDQRDLIIDIHQYLGWVLHSEAELLKNSGIINIDTLKEKLKKYLEKEGHKTDIADQLFDVLKERVCALVSRIQGTYEFEVQPLREYFCAKYLYKTSPYSPAGQVRPGTKPDRFDAIARNFYWQNITRFFAGCFDKGELPMLIQKLKELQTDELLKFTNYPRILISQILSDWVFTQYPLLMKDVVKIIIEGINIGNIISQENGSSDIILLPDECGRKELISECFEQLKTFPRPDYAFELIDLITNNPCQVLENWCKYYNNFDKEDLTLWLRYAYFLEILYKIDDEILLDIVNNGDVVQKAERLKLLVSGNKFEMVEKNIEYKEILFNEILKGNSLYFDRTNNLNNSLHAFSLSVNPMIIFRLLKSDIHGISFKDYMIRWEGRRRFIDKNDLLQIENMTNNDEIDQKINLYFKSIEDVINIDCSEWNSNLEIFDVFIEKFREIFHEQWVINIVAVMVASLRRYSSIDEEYNNLNDESKSLVKRIKYAKLRSQNSNYWLKQIDDGLRNDNLLFVLFILFSLSSVKLLFSLSDRISKCLSDLKQVDFQLLYSSIQEIKMFSSKPLIKQQQYIEDMLSTNKYNNEFILLVNTKIIDYRYNMDTLYKYITENNVKGINIADIRLNPLIYIFMKNPEDRELLETIKNAYSNIENIRTKNFYFNRIYHTDSINLSIEMAKEIMLRPKAYPRIIASFAEQRCRSFANENAKPVGKISEDNSWFE
jgi:hypothetical protein